MALVGNISGSGGVSSTIGVTGSVIIANRPGGSFPTLPGNDVAFFVSGNIAARSPGSPAVSPDYTTRGTTVFGGDVVVSGTLFGGSPLYIGDQVIARNGLVVTGATNFVGGLSGSLTKLNDGTSYLIAGTNVTITTGSNGAVTISSTGGGGGSGTNFFTETSAGVIYNSGTVAFTGARTGESITAASQKGTDVVFYFSGSNAALGVAGSNAALFGGNIVTSGSLTGKDSSSGVTRFSISNAGVISGSSDLQAGGNLTVAGTSTLVGDTTVSGDLAVNGSTSADITTTTTTATLFNTNATTVNIAGGATSGTTVGNATGGVTLNGTATVTGDLAVNGATSADITTTTATATVFNTTATSVSVGGAATTMTLGATSGNTTIRNNLIVKGDLYISGTTTTIDSTVMEVQDPIIGLGFASGSVAGVVGDRGFIGGMSGENNVAMYWDESEDGFAVVRTATAPGASPVVVTDYQTIRAGKLEVGGGTTAYVTSSVGSDILMFANGGATVKANTGTVTLNGASGKGTSFEIAGTQYAELKDVTGNVQFGTVGASRQITISGSVMALNTGGAVNIQQNGARMGQFVGIPGSSFRVISLDNGGVPRNLVLTGSGVDIGANSTAINFNFVDSTRGSLTYGSNTLQLGSSANVALTVSGSNGVNLVHGANGTTFIKEQGTSGYLVVEANGSDGQIRTPLDLVLRADGNDIKFNNSTQTVLTVGVAGNNANIQGANNQQVAIGAVGAAGVMSVSGSTVNVNAGAGGFVFQRDGVAELHVNAVGSTTTLSGSASQNVTLAAGTGATTLALSGSTVNLVGSSVNLYQDSTLVAYAGSIGNTKGFFPNSDSLYNLGDPTRRWANIYTGDLHLRNERGNWTIIEEEEYLSITNNISGKRYKFVLEEL